MIGIKGMELPKSCVKCERGLDSSRHTHYCNFGDFKFSEVETSNFYNQFEYRHPNCPLIDLGKEDMNWDELVEVIDKKYIARDNSFIRFHQLCFDKNGDVFVFNEKISIKINPYQILQIIKSLVGDER